MTINPFPLINRILSNFTMGRTRLVGVPKCCGATFVINLPRHEKDARAFGVFLSRFTSQGDHCFIAITNAHQGVAARVLVEHGFVLTNRFRNANTNSTLSVYMLFKPETRNSIGWEY